MLEKKEIISKLKELKPVYEQDGLIIVGLFGSYAKDTQNDFSDIDIAYKLNYDKFSKKYKDGFSKILKIDDIKEELQHLFKTKVDLVPDNNKALFKEIVYV
ncbi:MAG: nucleotidyltransferase family protein [Sulfurimonas sp.]|uniref:nucleotidyltransferase family protein n=1 Tax=Sulfurimonas sp. TaxID=2022749 RepID=UPI003D0CFF27